MESLIGSNPGENFHYRTDAAFKKEASSGGEVGLVNSIWWCLSTDVAAYVLEQDRSHFDRVSELDFGDGGFFACFDETDCRLEFNKGLFHVRIEYHGSPTKYVLETEKVDFLSGLAEKLLARIP